MTATTNYGFHLVAVLVVATLALAGCVGVFFVPQKPAEAAFPGSNGKIYFGHNGSVWAMNPDGTGQTELLGNNDSNGEYNPAVSPDGARIAFVFANHDIHVMNADGGGVRRITTDGNFNQDPAWSPDNKRIVFSRDGLQDRQDLFVVNSDGTGLRNLTNTPDIGEEDPAWSPDGSQIAYTAVGCDAGGGTCVYVMNADGTQQENLTHEPRLTECLAYPSYSHLGKSSQPNWSPDGSQILFKGTLVCPNTLGSDIWVMNADGTSKKNLTNDNGTSDSSPVFSPDFKQFAFQRNDQCCARGEIYTMQVEDPTNQVNITNSAGVIDEQPDWGPLSQTAPVKPPQYTIKELGTLPDDTNSEAYDVNDSGQVVGGSSNPSTGTFRAFLYSAGQMKDLGTLPGGDAVAYGVNDSGQVVGWSGTALARQAFLYSGGQMKALGTLPGYEQSVALDVNNSGQVTGTATSYDTPEGTRAFLYSGGQMKDLGTFGGSYSEGLDINEAGVVVGSSDTETPGEMYAFQYYGTQIEDLGTLVVSDGPHVSYANSINDTGKIVGSSIAPGGKWHAFVYTAGPTYMRDLGTLPGDTESYATDINDSGQIVGVSSEAPYSGERRPFLYSGGQMHDFNNLIPADSGWQQLSVEAINTSGQIVGSGIINGNTRAFLATPNTTENPKPTPPDTIPPSVTSTVPIPNATGVAPSANVLATFSEPMQPASVQSAFKLFKQGSTTKLSAVVTYDAVTKKSTLNPSANLRLGTTYKAVVRTEAKDVAGNPLDQNTATSGLQQKGWTFTIRK